MTFPLVLAQVIFAIAAILFIAQGLTDYNTKARRIVDKITDYFAAAALPISLVILIYYLIKLY